jgi:hypothetical protein
MLPIKKKPKTILLTTRSLVSARGGHIEYLNKTKIFVKRHLLNSSI